ncbi:non-specific lipid-transfer protein-like protein At2g13820 [Punica granatum]|uniref:Non-specific lipid-transfer protein-like protein At2g13820 n=2 Tax=Punica granatum TaxID=22663 RepID=A0A6P8CIB6_PUNGR|nr:non-specific lipid-transfer protein-like protein At2g13820 [Punica granatum]XP_031382940.1 non-specific lipid-transfer protein-like protein At2g13820 [Punica granatum]PKI52425.1 hypothetical protein CRG98_027178 [Punica granatum]
MEFSAAPPRFISALFLASLAISISPVNCQVTTSCTSSMISSFTPCINFVTNSSPNGTSPSPTSECCSSLKSLMGSGMDCLCLIVTGNVPFRIPINRTLAISLPRACKKTGVPLQCKASAAPLPAPGPAALGPTRPPKSADTPRASPSVPEAETPSLAPEADTTPFLTPPSPPTDSGTPTMPTGVRPVLIPSSTTTSYVVSPALLLVALGSLLFN